MQNSCLGRTYWEPLVPHYAVATLDSAIPRCYSGSARKARTGLDPLITAWFAEADGLSACAPTGVLPEG